MVLSARVPGPISYQVVVVGGTVAAAVQAVVEALAKRGNLAIVAWCPRLDPGELRAAIKLPVTDLVERAVVAPGRVYLAPRDRRVGVERDELVVGGIERSPLDQLFRAAADAWGTHAVGVLLAGIGSDGSLGITRIKETGGLTIAQQVAGATSELPHHAIESELLDLVLPLGDIANHIFSISPIEEISIVDAERQDQEARADSLRDILALVRVRSGHDFASYKRATLFRRIARRMQVTGSLTLDAYHRHLRETPAELVHLLRDLLISVTNFFRDGDAFAALANDIVPRLFANKTASDQLRVWVAGCATGEEAYSVGILMIEHAQTLASPPRIQIFATDIDERALGEARLGCYPDAIVADLSQERLQRFFMRENNQYRVVKELRELVLFSPHNVLRDPPFSRLDLVSCRNLLIYLNREAQSRVLAMFHFALRPEGVLLLGSSESAESSGAFGPLDPKHRLFARRAVAAPMGEVIATPTRWAPPIPTPTYTPPDRSPSLGELHYRIVENYAPPSALVNADLDVVHLSEHAGKYLQLAGGEPTRQVLRLVHPALQLDLRTAIYAARKSGSERRIVRFEERGETRTLELRVKLVELPELGSGAMIVLFDERPDAELPAPMPTGAAIEPVVRELEDELHRTRDQLRTTIEQYETSLEELKASNEELQAINEELRSATEELETSKEELQSVNEELTTLNHELKVKVDEISNANSDLQNLMTSTEIGVIFLDRDLDIKRFTPRIQDVFNIIPSDVGRPLAHVTNRLLDTDLVENAHIALETLRTIEKRVPARDGRTFLVRWLPYRSVEDRIDGVVITLIDVSDLRDAVEARQRTEDALELIEERLRVALQTAPIVVLSFDTQARLTWAYVMGQEVPVDRLELDRLVSTEDAELLRRSVHKVSTRRGGDRLELAIAGYEGRVFDLRVEPGPNGVTVVGFDITTRKMAEVTLREADLRKDEFLATLSHELRNPLAPLKLALEVARLTDHDPAQRARNLEVMERQVAMLSQLVDELLDLSRITHGKVNLERHRIELATVIDRAVEVVRHPDAPAVHVELPSQPIRVDGDAGRLVQIFTNLLSNAAKFTPPTGRIDLSAKLDAARQRVAIKIADTGAGIAPEMLPLIFELFVQSRHPDGRSRGGLGIGLHVVRRLVEMHGGTASVASEGVGKGSTFTVELPLAAT